MNRLRTVGARLSLALLVVVAAALGIVYLVVVPSLEDRLVASKLAQLQRAAPSLARRYATDPLDVGDFVENTAASTDARVVMLQPLSQNPPLLLDVQDSRQGVPSRKNTPISKDPVALRTLVTGARAHGTVIRDGERFAEVAVPASDGSIFLLSASLKGASADVDLVERRLLEAGLLALIVALVIGYGGASLFARRIRRLERAADRIAAGEFEQPVVDAGADELGELARAFDRMRVRLAQLDHARREFVANASHELRTPLFSLGGFLELLADEELDEPTRREFVETMHDQVERLTKLAEDLLDLTRLDAGRLRVEREELDVGAVAETVVDEFAAVATATEHPLELENDGDVFASADEQRVLQIARILVENALRHTPPGTPIRVRTERAGERAALVVEDDAGGIAAADAPHVFERFYRIEGTRASGSGLGLAIAKQLAELMGGDIELETASRRTAFALRLPAAQVPARFPVKTA